MEQQLSTSKVTVEYFDPHGLYKLIAPGLVSRLPLRHLHWQSHSGPLRSIDTLHVDLVEAGSTPGKSTLTPTLTPQTTQTEEQQPGSTAGDDGSQTVNPGGPAAASGDAATSTANTPKTAPTATRRHQIPGLRQTPYLKVLLVRCDSSDTYKSQARSEIRDWVKQHATASLGKKSGGGLAESHDAFEWMIIHVVIPNSAAYTQPRTSKSGGDGSSSDVTTKTATSRWGKSSSTLLEKLRSDFNSTSGGRTVDRVVQIRVGINDVPYELLPRVVPAVPGSYVESEKEALDAWTDLMDKIKGLILSSFDARVTHYEEDIHEKDMQRRLPGWNFCTFFILKEGLARGFESVGLVEDALVGYDELSVGLDTVIKEQESNGEAAEAHGGSLLPFTEDLLKLARREISALSSLSGEAEEAEAETADIQAKHSGELDDIPISSTKKPYRELILANNVSVFDFRCYIFSRQMALLLRLGNASSTREELLAQLKEQQNSVLYGVAPRALPQKSQKADDPENLSMLAEICRRALAFIPAVSRVMREDLIYALSKTARGSDDKDEEDEHEHEDKDKNSRSSTAVVVDRLVASYAFSIAQQILAQTLSKALPIPPSPSPTTAGDQAEPKASIPEPKTMMHPARASSLHVSVGGAERGGAGAGGRPPPSPGIFPGPGQPAATDAAIKEKNSQFLKLGLEDLAARRADLYMLSRGILEEAGKHKGWQDGWASAPVISQPSMEDMEDVSLDDTATDKTDTKDQKESDSMTEFQCGLAGFTNSLLRTALHDQDDFYRLYETLTAKALHHYTVADHTHSVHANMADLAVLKHHLGDFQTAATYFYKTTPFFGKSSWSLLELSMLIMYARCLRELQRKEDYVWTLFKLLSRAAEAEKDRIAQLSALVVHRRAGERIPQEQQYMDLSAFGGHLQDFLDASSTLSKEIRIPLASCFSTLELSGTPVYAVGQDSFSLALKYHSLLPGPLPIDKIRVHLVCTSHGGLPRDMWLESREPLSLRPGKGTMVAYSNSTTPGIYAIDQIRITSKNVCLVHDQPASNTEARPLLLTSPHVIVYQRTSALDVQLSTSKHLQLDKSNLLEVTLSTGWNEVEHCDLHIRAATGGLRLITADAKIVDSAPHAEEEAPCLASPIQGGVLKLGRLRSRTKLTIAFPFSIEQDALDLCVKIDVSFTTANGGGVAFKLSRAPSVSTALSLGVNVQDIFKHGHLFSRFTVSTATSSPLWLLKSELLDSDIFTSRFGFPPDTPPVVFAKQPASLLYRISRKNSGKGSLSLVDKDAKKTLYIKLYYSLLADELDAQFEASLAKTFGSPDNGDDNNNNTDAEKSASLYEFSKIVIARILQHVHTAVTAFDLERAILLGELSTSFLGAIDWSRQFPGLSSLVSGQIASTIQQWQAKNRVIHIPTVRPSASEARTILIPVDVPSITIVHTADIRLKEPIATLMPPTETGEVDVSRTNDTHDPPASLVFCVNQLLPATLHLKWTRMWDTGEPGGDATGAASTKEDLEFSFEVTAPTDTWLIGGRRKGHFIIPAPDSTGTIGLASTPETEAAIPLTLIPLREGWLPYPSVEIRQVLSSNEASSGASNSGFPPSMPGPGAGRHHCETDYRNLGETIFVVADRKRVTLSLDASGPGGGPLVLESEQTGIVGSLAV